jgi:predicted RNase H-like HicB family nuclease
MVSMRTYTYAGIAERGGSGDYGLYFPDLPGCVTVADTLGDLDGSAREALTLHLEGMLAGGEVLPLPTAPEALPHDPDVAEAGVMLITVHVGDRPSPTIIDLPTALLDRVDQAAQARGITRAAILRESAEAFLKAS